jgi:hypothetical protein
MYWLISLHVKVSSFLFGIIIRILHIEEAVLFFRAHHKFLLVFVLAGPIDEVSPFS